MSGLNFLPWLVRSRQLLTVGVLLGWTILVTHWLRVTFAGSEAMSLAFSAGAIWALVLAVIVMKLPEDHTTLGGSNG